MCKNAAISAARSSRGMLSRLKISILPLHLFFQLRTKSQSCLRALFRWLSYAETSFLTLLSFSFEPPK